MGLLQRGESFLNSKLGQAAAVAITYARGATEIDITEADEQAWIGRTAFSSSRVDGPRIEWGDRDYLIAVAALSDLGEPAEGDLITETINGTACEFKVLRPDTGEPAWRFSDPTRTRYRVHVKQVS